jgi:site-specific DNA recombinase
VCSHACRDLRSTLRGDRDQHLAARQQAICRAYAEQRDWTVAAVIEDIDVSATKAGLDRPGLDQLRQLVQESRVDVVIVWRLDRLARSVLDTLVLLKEFTDAKCATASATEAIDLTTPVGKAMAALIAIFAEMEADAIKARVRSSIDILRRSGRYAGGNLPYGYRSVPNTDGPGRVLVTNEEEAAVVREAADRVLAGVSVYAVSLDLNGRGVPTRRTTEKRRRTWTVQALRQVLTSDAILGRVVHRGELLRGDDGLPLQVWPPVLDLETWTRVRSTLGVSIPREVRPPRRRRSRLLSGLITCGLCGAPLYLRSNGAGHQAYGCSARSNGRACDGVSISADAVERYVVETFLSKVGDREVIEEVIEAGGNDADLADVQRAIDETAKEMTADDADLAELGRRLALLKERRAALKAAPKEPLVKLVPTGRTYRDAWEAVDLDGRRAILGAALAVLSAKKGHRGSRTFDPSRVVMISNPAHVAGVSTEGKSRWAVVVAPEE